jgi:acyl-CoA dehydrogenase family protein 9
MPGVSVGKTEKKLGIKGSSTTELIFEDVEVPEENILGELGRGFRVAMEVLNTGRLSLAAGAVGGGKELLRLATDYASQRKQFGKPILKFEMIREKLATMASDLYAMESMVYLTTGLVDQGVQDFSIESAMCKLFCSESLWQISDTALQIAGGYGYMTEYPYERHLRDARINRIFEGTNEIQKLYIALSGLKEPGQKLRDVGKALSNPIESIGTIGSYAAERLKRAVTHEHLTLAAPALKTYASHLESLTADLAARSDEVLRKHKKAIIQREYLQDRIAEAATYLYAMAACLSRATSRIETAGETEAAKDVMLCRVFCERAWRAARRRLRQVSDADFSDFDAAAKMIEAAGGYPL